MTKWLLALSMLATAWLSACGSDGGDGDDADATSTPSRSATVAYFAETDSDAINEVALEVHRLYQRAVDEKQLDKCDRAGAEVGYAAWRRCWHALLDPLVAEYRQSGTVLDGLIEHDRPESCQTELADAADRARELTGELTALLDDIDSDARRDQRSAMARYVKLLHRAYDDYSAFFVPLTNACYSPEDLATITASPSASSS